MPKATAVWLIENTKLTFTQIAEFCNMHELEIKAIANQESFSTIIGINPIQAGQLSQEELDRCSNDPNTRLELKVDTIYKEMLKKTSNKRKSKYTPILRRRDKPDAILWLIENIPLIQDNDIIKLIGTTKNTILAIKNGSHWNMKNIKPKNPVLLGLCKEQEIETIKLKYNDQI